eukprot:scaffold218390_cov51-Attheya_sp.AAC.1
MDSSPPMPTTNTLTRIDIPRSSPIPLPSLLLLRTWPERVVGASLDMWSMFPTQMQIGDCRALAWSFQLSGRC